jgi:mannose-6-phosphate isomerase-like protein (cupin superfamily)
VVECIEMGAQRLRELASRIVVKRQARRRARLGRVPFLVKLPRVPVPDCTLVTPFLNPMDSNSGLPRDLGATFSLAAGTIEAHGESKIHVHAHVVQVTYVLKGTLKIKLKDPSIEEPYVLALESAQAAVVEPGTFLQLINPGDVPASVLYVVGPPYVFEMDDAGSVVYDDAVVLDEDWDQLSSLHWDPPRLRGESTSLAARQQASRAASSLRGAPPEPAVEACPGDVPVLT